MSNQPRKIIDYDAEDTPNTDTHLSVDEKIRTDLENPGNTPAFTEGFAASSGVRPQAAETGGRVKDEETQDDTDPDRVIDSTETEIAGLADS